MVRHPPQRIQHAGQGGGGHGGPVPGVDLPARLHQQQLHRRPHPHQPKASRPNAVQQGRPRGAAVAGVGCGAVLRRGGDLPGPRVQRLAAGSHHLCYLRQGVQCGCGEGAHALRPNFVAHGAARQRDEARQRRHPHRRQALVRPPNEVGKQLQNAGHEGLHGGVELHHQVHQVLKTLRARVVQPRVHLCPPRLVRERRRVRHLGPDVVENRQKDAVENTGPKLRGEGAAVVLQRVKQHLQRAIPDVGAGVEGEFGEARQQGEPEVHVLVLVRETQARLACLAALGERVRAAYRAVCRWRLHLQGQIGGDGGGGGPQGVHRLLIQHGRAGLCDAQAAKVDRRRRALRQSLRVPDGAISELHCAEAQEGDGIESNI
mmetsp:Transcript_7198/g.21189  ORF Transcript_7198/g.21189 Transcript_7198/m.21189 type:complete len:374 (-) Transcript_7198:4706-5827(-)